MSMVFTVLYIYTRKDGISLLKKWQLQGLKGQMNTVESSQQFSSGFSYCFGLENSTRNWLWNCFFARSQNISWFHNRWLHHNGATVKGTTRIAADKTSCWIKINRDHVGCLKTNCISVARTSFFEFRFKFAFTTSWDLWSLFLTCFLGG